MTATTRRRRFGAAAVVVAVAASICAPVGPTGAADSTDQPAFTASKTVTRDHLVDGADQVVDSRTVQVSVSTTTGLRDRQGITVAWSGAHPTGGLATDPTAFVATYEEYPVMVMECRGTDSTTVPADQQVSPETCFTETPVERFATSTSGSIYPSYRMDRYAPPDQRELDADQPSPLPTDCTLETASHWVPFIGADGTVYPGGYQGCAGIAPDMALTTASLQPSSTTYGVANADGDGSTNFVVQTDLSNGSLGCSATVTCTLEVIPIEGISCDAAGAAPAPLGMPAGQAPDAVSVPTIFSQCSDVGQFAAGQFNSAGQPDYSPVTGQYWWSESNWRNRIAVPLTFAAASDVCDGVNGLSTVIVYGAESMVQATQQWAPALCLNENLFNLRHVQTSEPEAKNLLASGSIQGAFQAGPPDAPFGEPTVQAPTAITGFAIAAIADGADGQPVQVNLDARLLAKLLTESYEGCALNCIDSDAMAMNPIDITRDPEFKALNPKVPETNYLVAGAAMSLISSDSDVIAALTAYVNDDPEARAWLNGRPDPWGMVVNPAYQGITLPVESWPLLDTHLANVGNANLCLSSNPTPWLPLVASPIEDPAQIALNVQFNVANSQVACFDGGQPDAKLTALGREQIGTRFLLGLVSLADAERYALPTAALETHRSSDSTDVFTSADGRTFAAPTDDALLAAAKMLKPDDKLGTWSVPYDTMRTSDAGESAYPGILLISTDVQTTGLSKTDAKNYSNLLKFAAGSAQTPGIGNGQVPPGYLPMTSDNGLGSLVAYTKAAAAAVAAQQCVVPYPSGKASPPPSCNLPPPPPPKPTPTPSSTTSTTSTPSSPNAPTPSIPAPSTSPTPTPSSSSAAAPTTNSSSPVSVTIGKAASYGSGIGGWALPIAALLALLGFAASALVAPRRRR